MASIPSLISYADSDEENERSHDNEESVMDAQISEETDFTLDPFKDVVSSSDKTTSQQTPAPTIPFQPPTPMGGATAQHLKAPENHPSEKPDKRPSIHTYPVSETSRGRNITAVDKLENPIITREPGSISVPGSSLEPPVLAEEVPTADVDVADPSMDITPEDEEHGADDEFEEPPPPARPDNFQSPSPTSRGGSRLGSPSAPSTDSSEHLKRSQSGADLPRTSSLALVSYSAEDEVDRDDEAGGGGGSGLSDMDIGASGNASPSSTDAIQKKPEDQELDVDDYLEKALEGISDFDNSRPASEDEELITMPSGVVIKFPPKPPGKCKPEVQARINNFLAIKKRGQAPNETIQRSKKFRNPSMYEKLIDMLGLDEIGSNFPKTVFNPQGFKPTDFYDELAKQQKIAMDKLEKEKQQQLKDATSKHPSVPAAPTITSSASASSLSTADSKSRKSKWDQSGSADAKPPVPVTTASSSSSAYPAVPPMVSNIPVMTIPVAGSSGGLPGTIVPGVGLVGQAAKAAAALQAASSQPK